MLRVDAPTREKRGEKCNGTIVAEKRIQMDKILPFGCVLHTNSHFSLMVGRGISTVSDDCGTHTISHFMPFPSFDLLFTSSIPSPSLSPLLLGCARSSLSELALAPGDRGSSRGLESRTQSARARRNHRLTGQLVPFVPPKTDCAAIDRARHGRQRGVDDRPRQAGPQAAALPRRRTRWSCCCCSERTPPAADFLARSRWRMEP